jgi:transcriptional repressor NrdR
MKCPFCSDSSRVIDTREVAGAIRRRRECDVCGQRFTTYERVAAGNLQIVKTDGRREDFSREKLLRGLHLACAKRPVAAETVDEIAAEIESALYRLGKPEIGSEKIGELVMEYLRRLDEVAYVRFASVYRRFADLEVLADEIERLRLSRTTEEERKRQLALGI